VVEGVSAVAVMWGAEDVEKHYIPAGLEKRLAKLTEELCDIGMLE